MFNPERSDDTKPEKPPSKPLVDMSDSKTVGDLTGRLVRDVAARLIGHIIIDTAKKLSNPSLDSISKNTLSNNPHKIPVSEAIAGSLLAQLRNGKVSLSNRMTATHDKKGYNFSIAEGDNLDQVTLWSSDDGKEINSITNNHAGHLEESLSKLVGTGALNKEFLNKLGLASERIDELLKDQKDDVYMLYRLRTGNLSTLPNSLFYSGNRTNTETVIQNDAVVVDLQKNKDVNGLNTLGAGPCSILILTSGDQGKPPEKMAMAHIDPLAGKFDIYSLISRMDDPHKVQATLISGKEDLGIMIGRALDTTGVKISFANIDPDGRRVDGAVIDRQGKIYYGARVDLYKPDPARMQRLTDPLELDSFVLNKMSEEYLSNRRLEGGPSLRLNFIHK